MGNRSLHRCSAAGSPARAGTATRLTPSAALVGSKEISDGITPQVRFAIALVGGTERGVCEDKALARLDALRHIGEQGGAWAHWLQATQPAPWHTLALRAMALTAAAITRLSPTCTSSTIAGHRSCLLSQCSEKCMKAWMGSQPSPSAVVPGWARSWMRQQAAHQSQHAALAASTYCHHGQSTLPLTHPLAPPCTAPSRPTHLQTGNRRCGST